MFFSKAEYYLPRNQVFDAYREHQVLRELFGDQADGRLLYRRLANPRNPLYYLQSSVPPPNNEPLWHIKTKPYAPQLVAGQCLGFGLRVNPVVTTKDAKDKQRRHDVVMHLKRQKREAGEEASQALLEREAGLAWLRQRSERLGIEFDDEEILISGYRQREIKKRTAKRPVRISTLDFEGTITVVDPQRLLSAVTSGIGPAKGFGCGLLLLRRN